MAVRDWLKPVLVFRGSRQLLTKPNDLSKSLGVCVVQRKHKQNQGNQKPKQTITTDSSSRQASDFYTRCGIATLFAHTSHTNQDKQKTTKLKHILKTTKRKT